ncbi:DNA-directed RNA polymerase subunit beta [Bacillaceae bacterium W0354]
MFSEEKNDHQLNNEDGINEVQEEVKKERPSLRRRANAEEETKTFDQSAFATDDVSNKTEEQTIIRTQNEESPDKEIRPAKEILANIRRKRSGKDSEQQETTTEAKTKTETIEDKPNKRKEAKKAKKAEKKQLKEGKGRIRYIPVWLRVILIAAICIGAFVWGLTIGYGVIGEGENPKAVLDRDFWEEILKYIRGE